MVVIKAPLFKAGDAYYVSIARLTRHGRYVAAHKKSPRTCTRGRGLWDAQKQCDVPRLATPSLEAETTRHTRTTGIRSPGVALTGEATCESSIVGHRGFYSCKRSMLSVTA